MCVFSCILEANLFEKRNKFTIPYSWGYTYMATELVIRHTMNKGFSMIARF